MQEDSDYACHFLIVNPNIFEYTQRYASSKARAKPAIRVSGGPKEAMSKARTNRTNEFLGGCPVRKEAMNASKARLRLRQFTINSY
jgi:hypothetical protein